MPDSRAHRRHRHGTRVLRLVRFALQLLVMLVAVHASGLAAAVTDVVSEESGASDGCCSDCPVGRSGEPCPPGCPNCHCVHGSVILPAVESPHLSAAAEVAMGATPGEATAPRAPPAPGIYRPPRSHRAIA